MALAALDAAGFESIGLDISDWAVRQAAQRLGPGRVWMCDVENGELPHEVRWRRPFGTLVLSSVFEHFKLSQLSGPGTKLFIDTTNAESLTHALFDRQWEGYFDWTHLGIEQVSVKSLRQELPRLGWRIEELVTRIVWDGSADPTRATLREWWAADARFRRLLTERELGDLITCVAVKE